MKNVVDLAADRQPFIDQSQSLNIYMQHATYQKLTSMHFYGWKRGLKTGMYYLRTKPIGSAIKFTVDQEMVERTLIPSTIMKIQRMTRKIMLIHVVPALADRSIKIFINFQSSSWDSLLIVDACLWSFVPTWYGTSHYYAALGPVPPDRP